MTEKDNKKSTASEVEKPETVKSEIEELKEKATAAQKRRLDDLKKAPGDAPMYFEDNERDTLARRYVPEAFIHEKNRRPWGSRRMTQADYKKGSTKTAAWTADTKSERKRMSAKGYLPVIDNGEWITDSGGDILWEGPIEFEKAEIVRARKVHDERLKAEGRKFEEDVSGVAKITENSTEIQKN